MSDADADLAGTGLAFVVGIALGAALSAPMLPREVAGPEVTVGPTGASLLLAAVVVVVIPIALFSAYTIVAELDR